MAKDLGDTIGSAVGRVAREAAQSVTNDVRKSRKGKGSLGGMTGLAVGAGLAAAVPLAVKGASKLAKGGLNGASNPVKNVTEKATNKLSDTAKGVVDDKIKDAGGPGGIAKEAGKSLIPGMGGGDDKDGGGGSNEPGVGKGRRMPVQQAIDVGVPVSVAYNQFTQFEEWPKFMHRVQSLSQDDETHIKVKTKIWLFSREFTAEIEDQRPDERIEWHVTDGITHHGVATFHELAPRLTRVEISVDVEPSGLIEKSARGMRHVKRAIRADLHRFKAYTMMQEEADGEWRGTIEDGEVKEQGESESKQRESQSSRSSSRSSGSGNGGSSRSRSGSGSGSRSSSRSKAASSSSGNRRTASKSSKSAKSAKSPSSKRSSSRSRSTSNGSNGGDPSSSKSSSSRRKSGSRS
jgi:uncharacterized membrane protein